MAKLDFSSQAEPAAAPSSAALDFSAAADPVRKVGAGEMAARQFVGGGGDLLKALDLLGSAMDPGRVVNDALLRQQAKGASPATAQALERALHPASALGAGAQAYADLAPTEVPSDLGARVAGGVARSVPNLAGALAGGGGASLESLVPAALERVPLLGRALVALARGAPTAAAMTGTQAANLPDTLSPAEKLAATAESAGTNLAMAGLPVAVGSGPLVRTVSGAAIGAGIPAGLAALHGQPQDLAENLVGAFTGAALAQHGGMPHQAMDPHLKAYRDSAPDAPNNDQPRALPRGADYSAKAEPVRPSPVNLGGAVHVDATGSAATPAQGADVLARAIGDALAQQPARQLEPPVVTVDRAGNAATTADQNAALQPPASDPGEAMLAALGLTPDVRRAQANDPRVPREAPPAAPPALPAPTVTVDPQGVARTSRDYLTELRTQMEAAQAAAQAGQARRDLGITPDIERTQRSRWEAQQAAALDNQSRLDAQAAAADELAQQGQDDTPPWWMAAHGAELDHAANRARAAAPAAAPAPVPMAARPADADAIESLRAEIGWQERGGRMLRAVDAGGEQPEVVGRTPWVGKPGPGGEESGFWRFRPDDGGRLTEYQANAAIDKYTRGERLTKREQRFIDYARKTARDYADRHAQEQAAFEQDQADMDAAGHALARQELIAHGADYREADHGEALSLSQWVQRAHDAGVSAEAIIAATWDGTPADMSARLSRAIIEQESRHGTDPGAESLGREGDPGEDQAGQAAAGPVREEGARYALEAPVAPPATREVRPSQQGLFAPATAAERNRAAIDAKDAQRNGLGRDLVRPEQGAGELLAGPRPVQAGIEQGAPTALRRFMAGSKVVEADGRPRVVYHGTAEDFDVFGAHRAGEATGHATAPLGHFFTERQAQARRYAENASEGRPADERVIDAYLSIKHPAEWTMARMQRIETPEQARAARRNLEASGFDGIHIADAGQWIAFRPEQIKSASANRGTFDATDPSMLREARGRVETSSRDMFTRTRGDLEASRGQDQAGNGRQDGDSGRASPGGLDAGGLRRRPDGTPALTQRGEHEIDALVRRFGGSVLADTIARDFREKGAAQLVGQTARTIEDFAALAQVYRNPLFETMHYVFVDDAGRVVGESAVSSRLPSSSAAFPAGENTAWLVRAAEGFGATGVWLSHNHPSGVPTPSPEDVAFTRHLAAADLGGLKVLGHVVLDHTVYGTISPDGSVGEGALDVEGPDPLRQQRGMVIDDVVDSTTAIAKIGRQLADRLPERSIAVIAADARGHVSLATSFPQETLQSDQLRPLLERVARAGGAHNLFMVVPGGALGSNWGRINGLMQDYLMDTVIVDDKGKVYSLAAQRRKLGSAMADAMETGASARQVFDRGEDAYRVDLDMPSRRPGESQADYTRRVMRKNRDEIRQALALAKQQRAIGRQEFRAMLAKQARAADIADRAFAEARKMFDRSGDVVNLATIDEWETGRRVTDPDARDFFNAMQAAFDQRIAKIQQLAPDAMQQLIDHYFPHIWEDSAKALKWYQSMAAKRPLEGSKSFLKQRTWGTIREGMASGLKPVSTNPVDLVMLKLGQMDKFIAFHEFRQDLQRRGWLKKMEAGERVPLGYARIEDPAFNVAGGLQGYYAVPELIAKDVNNYLSPSLYRFGAWKALRTVQNVLMSARLGWSMFHAGFTTTDNLVMHADVAARRFLDGDIAGGLATLLKTPLTVVWSPIEGHKLNREWLGLDKSDAHTAAVLDMLEQGGARRTMSSTEYQNALPKVMRAIRRRALGDTLKEVLPAVGEASSWVIHHWLVPNQKMAARVMLAKFELDRLAGALGKERGDYAGIIDAMHPDVLKQIAGNVVNVVDDRLGQMTYDNQFWNKTAREVAQAFIGAVGWQVGTVRTVTGGVRDLAHLWSPEKLVAPLDKAGTITDAHLGRVSGRLTYLVSLGLIMGGLGALTQYLLTGEGPSEVKDYFFPKTGRRNDDGSDERLQYPSYWMDHYKLATHPLQTAMHKVHPSIGMFMEALANQDYFGVQIRDEDAPWWKQAAEVGEYVAKGFLPYSWTGHQELQDAKLGAGRQVANFFGVTKAPASVSRSPFQTFVAQKAYDAMPQGARTKDQAEHAQQLHELEAALRRGENPDLSSLSPREQRNVQRAARDEVPAIRFRRLSIGDKLRAYDLATPQEREEYKLRDIILRSNWRDSVRTLAPDERQTMLDRINAIAR